MESVMGLGAWLPETGPQPNRHQPTPGGTSRPRPLQLFRATRRRAVAASRLASQSRGHRFGADAPPAPHLPPRGPALPRCRSGRLELPQSRRRPAAV
jgi:hypothetical protein